MSLDIFQWRSLKTRVTIFTLVFFLIGIWSLAFFASRMLHEDMQRVLSEQQFSTVSVIAAEINSELNDRLEALEKVAARITPAILGNAASIQTFLEDRPALRSMFNAGIIVTRLDGTVIADTLFSSGRIGVNYLDREYLIDTLNGKSKIGNTVMGKKMKVPGLPISVPIRDAKGKVIGAMTGGINLDMPNFLSRITDNSYGKTGGYWLVSRQQRTIVFGTDKKRIMEVLVGPKINPLIDRYIQGYEGSGVMVNPVGVEVLSSAKGIPVAGWYIVAMIPTKEAFAPVRAMQKRMLLATIFLTLLAGGLTWWMLKRQLAPIFTTIKTLATLSDTDQPPQPLPIIRQDEIGELIGGFNHLLETLGQREEALQESEIKLRAIFENSVDAIGVSKEGMQTFMNPAYLSLFGYSSTDELINQPVLKLIAPTEHEIILTRIGNHAKGEVFHSQYETRGLRKDGTEFDMDIHVSTYELAGETYSLVILRDITERKQAEEEKRILEERLQRAEKMEALGQLAGGVAHDLNNVLGILSGYSELLLMEIPEGSRSRGHVEKILQSTEKGAAIIQDLLTLARRGVTASDVINLNSVVAGFLKTPVFEKMKDYYPRVTFRTEFDKNLLNIKGSPVHLEKTLMNLVSNAAEAISGQGEVTIRTESRYIDKPLRGYDEVTEGDYAVLTVSDTGMGIPAENREKIFEPFYTKKTMGRSGTGLGLAIVWGTVKDHHGYIDVQTEVGQGTTFTLYFPVTREELIAPQQKEPIAQYLGKGESVLVVDDIAEQRDIAARLLTRLGYEVHLVAGGEEAVEYLKENKADILVLDMIMEPGIDGLETYQRVLEIHPRQKAIMVSGFSETDRVREAQKLGAGAYVKKPYVMEKIGVAIRDELNR